MPRSFLLDGANWPVEKEDPEKDSIFYSKGLFKTYPHAKRKGVCHQVMSMRTYPWQKVISGQSRARMGKPTMVSSYETLQQEQPQRVLPLLQTQTLYLLSPLLTAIILIHNVRTGMIIRTFITGKRTIYLKYCSKPSSLPQPLEKPYSNMSTPSTYRHLKSFSFLAAPPETEFSQAPSPSRPQETNLLENFARQPSTPSAYLVPHGCFCHLLAYMEIWKSTFEKMKAFDLSGWLSNQLFS